MAKWALSAHTGLHKHVSSTQVTPGPRWAEEFPPALCGLEAVRLEFSNFVSVLGWPPPGERFGLNEIAQALHSAGQLIDPAPEAPLCQYLAGVRRDLVRSIHVAWIESHAWDDELPPPGQVYAWMATRRPRHGTQSKLREY